MLQAWEQDLIEEVDNGSCGHDEEDSAFKLAIAIRVQAFRQRMLDLQPKKPAPRKHLYVGGICENDIHAEEEDFDDESQEWKYE